MFTINTVLEYIFPKREDFILVQKASVDDMVRMYAPAKEKHWIALTQFSEPLVRASVHEVKYFQNEKAVILLGMLLEKYLHELSDHYVILPIPLGKKRRRKRKYNQVELLAKAAMHNAPHTLNTNVLYRSRETRPQTELKRNERIENMQEAFAVREKQVSNIQNKHIIILDDVVTTGATLHAAKAALLPHSPASVTCLALAH